MLTLKCAACRKKIWKYDKIGQGEVLRCHKSRIVKVFQSQLEGKKVTCLCGNSFAIEKGSFYKMIAKSFTYSGSKRNT